MQKGIKGVAVLQKTIILPLIDKIEKSFFF